MGRNTGCRLDVFFRWTLGDSKGTVLDGWRRLRESSGWPPGLRSTPSAVDSVDPVLPPNRNAMSRHVMTCRHVDLDHDPTSSQLGARGDRSRSASPVHPVLRPPQSSAGPSLPPGRRDETDAPKLVTASLSASLTLCRDANLVAELRRAPGHR